MSNLNKKVHDNNKVEPYDFEELTNRNFIDFMKGKSESDLLNILEELGIYNTESTKDVIAFSKPDVLHGNVLNSILIQSNDFGEYPSESLYSVVFKNGYNGGRSEKFVEFNMTPKDMLELAQALQSFVGFQMLNSFRNMK